MTSPFFEFLINLIRSWEGILKGAENRRMQVRSTGLNKMEFLEKICAGIHIITLRILYKVLLSNLRNMTSTNPPTDASYNDRIGAITPTQANIELNPVTVQQNSRKENDVDAYLVSFASLSDQLDPKNWPRGKKWAVTDVLSATGFNRIMVSTIMAPALSLISQELNMSSTESAMALSIYLLATAIGPLMIGPLSEVYGRKPILHASNIWFLVWNLVCGFANSKKLLIAARFLAGFGASAIYALASGVLGDIWHDQERGQSLGAYLLIPLLGAAVGTAHHLSLTTWPWELLTQVQDLSSVASWPAAQRGDGCFGRRQFSRLS